MRALKALVIGMGVLIVLAIALLAFGLYKKSVDPGWRLFGPDRAPAAAATKTPEEFADIALDLGTGCRIVGVRPEGRRVYLLIGPDAPCSAVVVVDIETGRVLGRIAGDGR